MQFSEWIGLFISLFAFAFLVWHNLMGKGRPETEEQKKRLEEFLKGVNADMQPKTTPSLPKPKTHPPKVKQAKVQREQPKPMMRKSPQAEVRSFASGPSIVATSVKGLRSKKQMVIFRELLDSPRAFRPWDIYKF